jgi:ABC-type multidrug transport system fused ATPase/permease subunit
MLLVFGMFLLAINRLSGLVLPYSTRFLIDDVIGKHHAHMLLPLALVLAITTIVQGFTTLVQTQLLSKTSVQLIAELRQKMQEHIGRLPIAYYDANKTGALVSRIMSDAEGVRNLIGTGLVDFAGGLMTAVIAFVILFQISPMMTTLTATFVFLLSYVLSRGITKMRPMFRERGDINAEVTGRLAESLSGVRIVKSYHAESREAEVFATGVKRLFENSRSTLVVTSIINFIVTVLMGIVGALVVFIGARQVIASTLSLGEFVVFIVFQAFLTTPVYQVVVVGTQLSEALAGLERIRAILRELPEDCDPCRTVTLNTIRGEVIFESVQFSYKPGKQILFDVSFRAEPGTVTALVGPSGAGKSTITSLIAAFYIPTSGRISVDGTDLSKLRTESYRTHLGVVLQDTFLFDGTIEDNVALAKKGATKQQILDACRIANVDEFVEKLENKYDTLVGERGVKLSGGQRQRVSIARAILADPRILILDEATSSLDSESESLIQAGLKYLMKCRTTFVIAHRLSTIRRAEQILVIERGRIVECGAHEHLYSLRGRYWDLYNRQYGVEANLSSTR